MCRAWRRGRRSKRIMRYGPGVIDAELVAMVVWANASLEYSMTCAVSSNCWETGERQGRRSGRKQRGQGRWALRAPTVQV